MCKYALFLIVTFSIASSQSQDLVRDSTAVKKDVQFISYLEVKKFHDPWFSQDKFLHFSACAAISGLTYHFYVNRLNRDEERGKVYAISLTALVGLGKEIYDKQRKGHFSCKDLVWDALGLAVGYFVFVH